MLKEYALITGASNGIGLEFSKILASKGFSLILVARSAPSMEKLAIALKTQYFVDVKVFPIDLAEPTSPQLIYNFVEKEQIFVSILVNNAGFGWNGYFSDEPWMIQRNMMQVNMVSLCELTHLFLPKMKKEKKGKILNVSSTAAFQPGPFMSVYYATKAFVLNFSEALSEEVKPYGITVSTLCPGPTQSGFQQSASMDNAILFRWLPIPSSKTVADYGFEALIKGKTVAIHGWFNALLVFLIRFSPRFVVRKMVMKLQKPIKRPL